MKFTYDEEQECVAFIDADGNLAIACNGGEAFMISPGGGYPYVGGLSFEECGEEQKEPVKRKFYPGDRITIEF